MKSVIYLDELLLTNFVLAALFLTAAGLLCATVCTGVRLCTGAALAAVSALVLLAPELPGAVAVGYKIFTGCAVVAAAYGLPLLAKMPIDPQLAKLTDDGCIEQFEGHWLDGVVDAILKK